MASNTRRKRKHVEVGTAEIADDRDWLEQEEEEETILEDNDEKEEPVLPNNARKPPLNPKRKASIRKPSMVWNHFTKENPLNPIDPKCVCNYCHAQFACDGKANGTSHLIYHIKSGCRSIPRESDKRQKSLAISSSSTSSYFTSSTSHPVLQTQLNPVINQFNHNSPMAIVVSQNTTNALTASFNDQIRPLLDAIDRLRHLKVMQEGIELPTIVVVGDHSSGKSSVLESLAGISLPRGQGICTRVPLIMRLQDDSSRSTPELHLEYLDKKVPTSEQTITEAINSATDEIAGNGKGICGTPLTLVVKKRGVPDLTMVDLPGITRVPVHGQPEDIYEQISKIIMEYISPRESIILNVLSASVDFPTWESIRMSQQVDKNGERTLAVVTIADRSPEGLLEKVTVDAVNIGLGYVCVRNRVGDETYEQARAEEVNLFHNNPHLSKIDKSIVGIPVLAQRLMQIQAASISRCLPDIVRKINEKLSHNVSELDSMPQNLSSVSDAIRAFMQMISSTIELLRNIILRGEYEDTNEAMHGRARLADMLLKFSKEMPLNCPVLENGFLMDEIHVLEECKGIGLPNFIPRNAFQTLLQRKLKLVSDKPFQFVSDVWLYIEVVVLTVVLKYSDNYPQLQSSARKAVISVIEEKKKRSIAAVKETIEKEMAADYTINPDYMNTWHELMEQQGNFMEIIQNPNREAKIKLEKFGEVEIGHLRKYSSLAEQAYDMRMRLNAYWKIVIMRMVDEFALHILHSLKKLVEEELEAELVNEVVGSRMNGIERMLEEAPMTAGKRERLKKSIELLKESKMVVSNLMDKISSAA